jgi:hypothetical protein
MKNAIHMLRLIIIGICLFQAGTATSQTKEIITGRVLEAGTNKPIRNASIYFDGTLNGSTSDSTGSFTLYPQTNKNVPVVVNALGYDIEMIKDFPVGKKVIVYLNLKNYDLETVTIKINDGMSRKEKLKIFRTEFLGISVNARNCEILNEDDIRLTYTKKTKTIKAFSEKPIVVRNKNLGYIVRFLPVNIVFSPDRIIVQGYQFFEEDPSGAGHIQIQKARQIAYLGSQIHFVRSLWNNQLKGNGFNIYQGNLPATYMNTRFLMQNADNHMLTYDSIVSIRNNDKYIHLNGGSVHINYKGKTSYLTKIKSNGDALINKNGYSDPTGIIWSGFIGEQRIGDALPLEYNLEDNPGLVAEPMNTDDADVKSIIASADTLRSRMPAEKLYIQFDKPYYIIGDTIRMKAYLFDAAYLKASSKSGIAYVEMANDTNKVLFRRMLPMEDGLGAGNIVLNKDDIPEGSYTLRAYTNLMRNFGEDLIFKKDLYISGSSTQNWLVNSKAVRSKLSGKDNMRLALQINQFSKQTLGNHELDLRILDGKKTIQRDKVKTDADGKLDVNFNLPDKINGDNLTMILADSEDANHKINIPIPVSREENVDLQFMPEGGNLVAGITSFVGFKAIGEDGKGVTIIGKVLSSSGSTEVTVFSSAYKGMGSFEFTPKAGESYTAKIDVNGITKSFPLPAIKSNGTVLKLTNDHESDLIEVAVSISPVTTDTYYLTAQSRGVISYGAVIRFNGNNTTIVKIAKSLFPTGIVRFTVLNADKQPLNERLAYIDHKDNLNVSMSPVRPLAGLRDSIALHIEVKDKNGNPVQGSFSLAVTDDGQVKADSLAANILTSLLLTSDLKGTVEDPGHYLQQTPQAQKDLDCLLLTQGWTGYSWKDVFNPPVSPFTAESEFAVTGRITNLFNKGIANAPVQLLSLKPAAAKIGLANNDGSFRFTGLPVADSLQFFLKAKNKNEESSNIGIEVDHFKPPVFTASSQRMIPWYVNSDTTLLRQVNTQVARNGTINSKSTNILESVTITGKKIIKESKNLNGPGESDQALDEKDLLKDPKMTLLDVMKEKIKGFNLGIWPTSNPPPVGLTAAGGNYGTIAAPFVPILSYRIYDKEVHLVIDGVDVERFYVPNIPPPKPITGRYVEDRNNAIRNDRLYYIESYLNSIRAEDVTGVEIMSDSKYNGRYKSDFAVKYIGSLSAATTDFAYVEVTTRSGNGAFMKTMPGTYLYKPIPYVNSTAFYRPKYIIKTNPLSDFRSTIHWEPDIITDKDGKATVSFYSADRPGTYSIIMEGANMNGSIGRQTGTLIIK